MIPTDVVNPLIAEKHCDVTVEGQTISVRAQTLYYAALAYAGAQNNRSVLKDDTVIGIKVEGESAARTVRWGDVVRWATPTEFRQ
jgi:hypothetical protein